VEFLIAFGRYILPLLAAAVLLSCAVPLLSKNTRIGTVAYLINAANGDRIALRNFETSIGRSTSCDIVLAYPTVSRFHSVISKRAGKWIVFDTNSKTGTFVNGNQIVGRSKIFDGDSILFGSAEFTFYETLPELGDTLPVRKDPTVAKRAPVSDDKFSSHCFLENDLNGEEFSLDKLDSCMIGRSDDAQIQIASSDVSNVHALITRNRKGFTAEDLGSKNGTYLNGEKLIAATQLFDGDSIKVGNITFTFRTNDIRS
jgi:pSer/pThr/pTyr-binding forkhead associated (FHA) protein